MFPQVLAYFLHSVSKSVTFAYSLLLSLNSMFVTGIIYNIHYIYVVVIETAIFIANSKYVYLEVTLTQCTRLVF